MPPYSRFLSVLTTTLLLSLIIHLPIETPLKMNTAIAQPASSNDQKAEAKRLLEQGNQQFAHSEYQEALQSWQQAMDIYRKIGDRNGEANSLNNLGNAYFSLGQYPKAIDCYEQSLVIRRETGDYKGEGNVLVNLGVTYRNLSQYAQALEAYRLALELFRKINDSIGMATVLNNIGLINNYVGQYLQALESLQQALSIFKKISDLDGQATTLNNIGISYERLEQYPEALEYFRQAYAINPVNSGQLRETLLNIGTVYRSLGQCSQSLKVYQQALGITREIGDRQSEGIILINIGAVYDCLEQHSYALESYIQALSISRETGNRVGEETTLNNIGLIYVKVEQYSQALDYFQQALLISKEIGDRSGKAITLGNIGFLLAKQNQSESAIVFYKQSVNATETIRYDNRKLSQELQQSYTNTIAGTYRRLSDLLLAQGRILEAQQVLELLKLQELREFTGVRARVTSNGIELTPTEQAIATQHNSLIAFGQRVNQCQKEKCSQLTALLDQRDQLTQQFNQTLQTFEAQIRARLSQDRAALDTQDFNRAAREIVEAQPGTVVIYAVVLDDKLWLLWATAGGVVNSVEVPVTQQKLGETVLQFRQLLSTPNSDITQVQKTAKQLYDWLIAPIAPELQKNHIQHLVFSLDRVTRYIPMAALFDGQHYLLENYTVSTVLSADLTRVGDRLPPGTDQTSVLALGLSNPVPPDFPGLPNVPAELDAIVRSANDPQGIYPGLKFLNQQFDDHTLRDNVLGHQIVHIATHGVFVPGRQDQSYLVLGNGNHMSISSIQDLQDLDGVRLVVLSACQTALGGPDQDGIEIAGIAYYFLNGGVNTVMASLWSVNDASTQQLMQHLYHNLAQSTAQAPITRAEALRQAQLSLLQGETNGVGNAGRSIVGVTPRSGTSPATPTSPGLSHPYYWAPFILIGNGL